MSMLGDLLGDLLGNLLGAGGDTPAPTPEPPVIVGDPEHFFATPCYSDTDGSLVATPVWVAPGFDTGDLSIANVQTDTLGELARSVDLSPSNTKFWCNLQQLRDIWSVMALGNWSPEATARVTFATSEANVLSTDPADWVHQSSLFLIWPVGETVESLGTLLAPLTYFPRDEANGWISAQARWVLFEIFDAGNPAGTLDVYRVMVAGRVVLPYQMALGAQFGMEDDSEETVLGSGSSQFDALPVRRTIEFDTPRLEEALAFGALYKLQHRHGRSGVFFFVYDINDPLMHVRSLYGSLRRLGGSTWAHPLELTTKWTLLERR